MLQNTADVYLFNATTLNTTRRFSALCFCYYCYKLIIVITVVAFSWGPDWGEGGYMSISREVPNACGITSNALSMRPKDPPKPAQALL